MLYQKQILNRIVDTVANAKLLDFTHNDIVFITDINTFYYAIVSVLAENIPSIIVCNNGIRLIQITNPASPPSAKAYASFSKNNNQVGGYTTLTRLIFNTTRIANPDFTLNNTTGVVTVNRAFNYLKVSYKLLMQKLTGANVQTVSAYLLINGVTYPGTFTADYVHDTNTIYSTNFMEIVIPNIVSGTTFEVHIFILSSAGNTQNLINECLLNFEEINII